MEKDPVCGMLVDPVKAAGKKVHEGRTYYFWSTDCMKKFEQVPQRYATPVEPKKR